MENVLHLGLGNYYGEVELLKNKLEDIYYLSIGNYDGDRQIKISKKLADAIIEEFTKE